MLKTLFIYTVLVSVANGANILGIFGHASRSHHILGEILFRSLAERGHNVTMASPYPLKRKIPNYTDLNLTGILEDHATRQDIYTNMNENKFIAIHEMLNVTRTHTELTLTNPALLELIESGTKFDLVIVNWAMSYALLIYGELLKAPIIALAPPGNIFFSTDLTGNPTPPSYIPLTGSPFPSANMTFFERLGNSVITFGFNLIFSTNIKYHDNLLKRHFSDPPGFDQLRKRVALVLSNAHFVTETPRPYLPSVINVGGFHIPKSIPDLPSDLQAALDGASNGVIYFSLGTNMKSNFLSLDTQKQILAALSRLDQLVLWKWNGKAIENAPKNVLLSDWFPQNAILAHPNTKLFISHGGLLSTIESIYFGVPIVGIPIFGDQKMNIDVAVQAGYAEKINLNELNEQTLREQIKKVLTNEKYKSNVKQRSILLREQPIHPLDHAIFWVEHVIRHQGAPHLQIAGRDLSWYSYFLVDVIIFTGICLSLLSLVVYFTLKCLFKKIVYVLLYKEKVD